MGSNDRCDDRMSSDTLSKLLFVVYTALLIDRQILDNRMSIRKLRQLRKQTNEPFADICHISRSIVSVIDRSSNLGDY